MTFCPGRLDQLYLQLWPVDDSKKHPIFITFIIFALCDGCSSLKFRTFVYPQRLGSMPMRLRFFLCFVDVQFCFVFLTMNLSWFKHLHIFIILLLLFIIIIWAELRPGCPLKGTGTRDLIWLKVVSLDRSWLVGLTDDL